MSARGRIRLKIGAPLLRLRLSKNERENDTSKPSDRLHHLRSYFTSKSAIEAYHSTPYVVFDTAQGKLQAFLLFSEHSSLLVVLPARFLIVYGFGLCRSLPLLAIYHLTFYSLFFWPFT